MWTHLDEMTRIAHDVVVGIEPALHAKYLADLSRKFTIGESSSKLPSPPLESPDPSYASVVVQKNVKW